MSPLGPLLTRSSSTRRTITGTMTTVSTDSENHPVVATDYSIEFILMIAAVQPNTEMCLTCNTTYQYYNRTVPISLTARVGNFRSLPDLRYPLCLAD